jgi:arginine transport system permease protein
MDLMHSAMSLSSGLLTTLELMLFSLIFGLTLAIALTFVSQSKYLLLRWPVDIFIFFIRGTPLLVQIFLLYFGLAQFHVLRHGIFWPIISQPFACAVAAFSLNTCAYTIVLLRGAIQSVPRGEVLACQALGMTSFMMLRRVIFPRAFRLVLPAYSNEVIMILKGTTLASTITVMDLMGVTNQLIAQTYQTIPLLLLAGAIYLVVNLIVMNVFHLLERRYRAYLRV